MGKVTVTAARVTAVRVQLHAPSARIALDAKTAALVNANRPAPKDPSK